MKTKVEESELTYLEQLLSEAKDSQVKLTIQPDPHGKGWSIDIRDYSGDLVGFTTDDHAPHLIAMLVDLNEQCEEALERLF